MKLSDLKWWHWTLLTVALAAAIRLATGGPLPFVGQVGASSGKPATASAGRPERKPNEGPSVMDVVNEPAMRVSMATPERDRLTLEAQIDNPGTPTALVDATGKLVLRIAEAIQKGVKEDSTPINQVRILVATKGIDRTGREVAHLSLYSLTYKASDLYALKPTATPGQALAPATNLVFNGADAHNAMRDWCKVEANLNQAAAFCRLVTTSKGV